MAKKTTNKKAAKKAAVLIFRRGMQIKLLDTVSRSRMILLRRKKAGNRVKGSLMMPTAAWMPITVPDKREDTAGGSINTRSALKTLTVSRNFKQKTILSPMTKAQSLSAVRNWTNCSRKQKKPGRDQKRQGVSCLRKRNIPLNVSLMKSRAKQNISLPLHRKRISSNLIIP